jgi:hypothetical protein
LDSFGQDYMRILPREISCFTSAWANWALLSVTANTK